MTRGIVFAILGIAIVVGTWLASCTPHVTPPPAVIVDASDAATLLDAGEDASLCTRACRAFAQAHCTREARGQCPLVCEVDIDAGLIAAATLECVVEAGADRTGIQHCGKRTCR